MQIIIYNLFMVVGKRSLLITILLLSLNISVMEASEAPSSPFSGTRTIGADSGDLVDLTGLWFFYPDQLLNPGQLESFTPLVAKVPGNWRDYQETYGSGTYCLKVRFIKPPQHPGIDTGLIRSASVIWVNGKEIFKTGQLRNGDKREIPGLRRAIIPLEGTDNGEYEIIIQVTNHTSRKGGIERAGIIGPLDLLHRRDFLSLLPQMILTGAFLMIGIYHLGYHLLRRKEKSSLVFSLLTGTLAFRLIVGAFSNRMDIFPSLENIPWEILKKGEYAAFFGAVWAFLIFYRTLFKKKGSHFLFWVVSAITLSAIGATLILPYRIYNHGLYAFQIFMAAGSLYILVDQIRYIRSYDHKESTLFLAAFIVFFLCSFADILTNQMVTNLPPLSPFGFFVFILFQGLILSRRYSATYSHLELMSRDLNSLLAERKSYEIMLERRVFERTSELEKASEEASTANRAKGDFLARMSHEIRTPLNGILGFAEILQESINPADKDHYAELIINESDRLLQLINQLLDIAKIDAGQLTLESHTFQIGKFIKSLESVFRPRIEARGLQFIVSIPEMPGPVIGDSYRLRQILYNLLSNSLKFTETGSIELTIAESFSNETRINLLFLVKDTGIGITDTLKEDIFQPFIQADSSITRKFGGTGLGTTIAKTLVEQMQGQIGVENNVSGGCTFWFEIPLIPGREQAEDSEELTVRYKFSLSNLKVLLVEDYQANQEIAIRHLESTGCMVILAENGQEAVDKFSESVFDLVCMDLHMPVMDGFMATRKIRTLRGGETAIIIGLTADAFGETRQRCLEAGMNDVMTKPFRKQAFLNILAKWSGRTGEMEPIEI
jgi:signal transduction histidine kinase/CheY-like chemotaxis protein